jgi:geranylgeranyl diphosphate synthase type I
LKATREEERVKAVDIERFLEEKAPLIDKTIEKYIPRKFTENAVLFRVNPPRHSYNVETLNKAVAEPIWEFLDRGGKRWRPALCGLLGFRHYPRSCP